MNNNRIAKPAKGKTSPATKAAKRLPSSSTKAEGAAIAAAREAKRTNGRDVTAKRDATPLKGATEKEARTFIEEAAEAMGEEAKRAKRKAGSMRHTHTIDEIVSGLPPIAKTDWRAEFHGKPTELHFFIVKNDANATFVADEKADGTQTVLLAMPRDGDVLGFGSQMRAQGYIAVHVALAEDGASYIGAPFYLREDELRSVLPKAAAKPTAKKPVVVTRKGAARKAG